MDFNDYEIALAHAKEIAALDVKLNGHPANAPYDLIVQNTRFRARLRSVRSPDKSETCFFLEVYQPERHIGRVELFTTK